MSIIKHEGEIIGIEMACRSCFNEFTVPIYNFKYNKTAEHDLYPTSFLGARIVPCIHCPRCDYANNFGLPDLDIKLDNAYYGIYLSKKLKLIFIKEDGGAFLKKYKPKDGILRKRVGKCKKLFERKGKTRATHFASDVAESMDFRLVFLDKKNRELTADEFFN